MEHTRTLQTIDRYDGVGQSALKRGPTRIDWSPACSSLKVGVWL